MSHKQFGFTQRKASQDAIMTLTKVININMDTSNKTMCIFIDLRKAFNTVSYIQFLDVREGIGFRGVSF